MAKLYYLQRPGDRRARLVKDSPSALIAPSEHSFEVVAIVEDCETGERIAVRKSVDMLTPLDADN